MFFKKAWDSERCMVTQPEKLKEGNSPPKNAIESIKKNVPNAKVDDQA